MLPVWITNCPLEPIPPAAVLKVRPVRTWVRTRPQLAGAAIVLTVWLSASAAAAPVSRPADTVTAALTRGDVPFRTATEVDGHLLGTAGPIGGAFVLLEASPYPYKAFRLVAHTATTADGSFSFTHLLPDRDTRYRVAEAGGSGISGTLLVIVEAHGVTRAIQLRYGFVMVTLHVSHPRAFDWNNRTAYWFVAQSRSRRYHLIATTLTSERRAGETYASLTFVPPLGRFTYRVCFNAPGEEALGPPGARHACPTSDFKDRVASP